MAALQATPTVRTLKQVAQIWLAQHPGKPATVEGSAGLMAGGIWPELTWTDSRADTRGDTRNGGQPVTRRVELSALPIQEIRPAELNQWTVHLSAKPDARRRARQPRSPRHLNAHLRLLKACLNWAVAHGYLETNRAGHVTGERARRPHRGVVPHSRGLPDHPGPHRRSARPCAA